MRLLLVFLGLACTSLVAGKSSGANEPIADNELGLTAQDCALQYCSNKDGLALWLVLSTSCLADFPYHGIDADNGESFLMSADPSGISEFTGVLKWTPTVAGSICAIVGLVGLLMGYSTGVRQASKIRKAVEQEHQDCIEGQDTFSPKEETTEIKLQSYN